MSGAKRISNSALLHAILRQHLAAGIAYYEPGVGVLGVC